MQSVARIAIPRSKRSSHSPAGFGAAILGELMAERCGKLLQAHSQRFAHARCFNKVETALARFVFAHVALRKTQALGQLCLRQFPRQPKVLEEVAEYLVSFCELRSRHPRERIWLELRNPNWDNVDMSLIDIIQDPRINPVLAEFYPRFTPGGLVLWVAERSEKPIYQSRSGLARCGMSSLPMGELSNVGVFHLKRGWLALVDIASIRGSMTSERRDDLAELFSFWRARLVFVTVFQSRRELRDSFEIPAWGTAAWFSEEPDHLIHFNSQGLSGPKGLGA